MALHIIGTYLRICHLNSPLEATVQFLNVCRPRQRSPSDCDTGRGRYPWRFVNEPLEAHNVAALEWWLLCHDIKLPSSCRKRQGKPEDWKLNTAPLEPPSIPPAGWEVVSADNYKDFTDKIPQMMPGTCTFTEHAVAALVLNTYSPLQCTHT